MFYSLIVVWRDTDNALSNSSIITTISAILFDLKTLQNDEGRQHTVRLRL